MLIQILVHMLFSKMLSMVRFNMTLAWAPSKQSSDACSNIKERPLASLVQYCQHTRRAQCLTPCKLGHVSLTLSPWRVDRRGAATLEEAEARMLSRKHAHQQLNGKLAALASKGAILSPSVPPPRHSALMEMPACM